MKLIDKDALVAEIEKIYNEDYKFLPSDIAENIQDFKDDVLRNIDSQEVKDFWKSADGDDLPEIDREVIALLDNGKVVFAHRPPEFWDGKNIITGKVTRYYPKTYGKGGWNIPDVKWWLDCYMDSIFKRNDENNKIDKR